MTFINNDNKEEDEKLIDKYIRGELTTSEKSDFEERMKSTEFQEKLSEAQMIAGSAKYIALKDKLDMLKDLEDSLGKNDNKSDS